MANEANRGILDEAIDILKERLGDAKGIIREQYKGVRPFRYKPTPPREKIQHYLDLTDEQKEMYRQTFGEQFGEYERSMNELIVGRMKL